MLFFCWVPAFAGTSVRLQPISHSLRVMAVADIRRDTMIAGQKIIKLFSLATTASPSRKSA